MTLERLFKKTDETVEIKGTSMHALRIARNGVNVSKDEAAALSRRHRLDSEQNYLVRRGVCLLLENALEAAEGREKRFVSREL